MSVSRLKIATPYMMTIDGNLHECGEMHPYLKYIYEDSAKNQIQYLFKFNWVVIGLNSISIRLACLLEAPTDTTPYSSHSFLIYRFINRYALLK